MVRTRSQGGPALRVAFLHPDLGLGGAERLIVDAAVELAGHGHKVDVYTACHDPTRCFAETVGGPFSVTVAGGWFPRALAGRCMALCAYVRCALVALHIAWRCWVQRRQYDVIIVDQVAAVVPLLRALTSARVLFYCHFPDLLLATRRSRLHSAYRAPLDWLEQQATGASHALLVNSRFTQGVFADTFKRLDSRGIRPGVLYPAVAIPSEAALAEATAGWRRGLPPDLVRFVAGGPTFLSINRFERKKGIGLAVEALQELRGRGAAHVDARLVVAGGYDPRLPENVEHLEELRALAERCGVAHAVAFLPSFSDVQRGWLLGAATAVLYTPQAEHFGIVPLEAMAAARPVVACDSGGPKESVLDGTTGFLRPPLPAAWADAMAALLTPGAAARLGAAARQHVRDKFSRSAFGDALNEWVLEQAAQRGGGGARGKRGSTHRKVAARKRLRDAPLGGLLQKYKDAEAAWLKEKGRLALAVKNEAARRQKAEGELRRSGEQLAFRVGEVKHLKEALKGRDGTIQDLQDRLRAFELADGEERTAAETVRQAEAERDELRGAMGELLQRLSAANQVVGQAEAEVERLEGQSVEAAQTAAAAQADAAAARAEAAGLREEVAELQWKCSLLQQLSDLTLKQNDEKTSTLRQLLESESLLDGEAGSGGEADDGSDVAAALGGARGSESMGLYM
ncbi:alpha-1,3 1,6-mannosyltransferase ALG2 [Micractinium conductrix]|uniref:Alpha-1,3/1,6-mannosyltransferase ALG2 n=1 Tax=Micractinium conductrix TaxID=554055 RepID=A0A2P6VBS9_9CHLO|nr:alpha-1,3 1,6-mannosyltransferase ALG2 [Micractinium conductrix]|eukprot:PSC71528.1 alpha-1,3 1,6-mannosyltransferase ALG2 [Micractinium conductrix]